MKILLFTPIKPRRAIFSLFAPLGLGYLATSLRRKGHEVKIVDCCKEFTTIDKLKLLIKDEKPDITGIQLFTPDILTGKQMVSAIKEVNPVIITGVGGPHVSGRELDIFKDIPEADYAFAGEAEIGFSNYTDFLVNKGLIDKCHGLLLKDYNGKPLMIDKVFHENLDELGFPSWDLMDPRTYPVAPPNVYFKASPFAPIITTRGCPYGCNFCQSYLIAGRKIRKRSIEHIKEEIDLLMNKYCVKEIFIVDDNFTYLKEHVINFCEMLLSNNIKIHWSPWNGIRLDTLDEEILRLMIKSGCYMIKVGIESGSPRILKAMNKHLTLEVVREKLELVRKAGMEVFGFFILGYPGETTEDLRKTYDFALSLPLTGANFANYQPLPGTPVYKELILNNKIDPFDWDPAKGTFADINFVPDGMTKEELKAWQRKMLISFYFRPKTFGRIIYRVIQSRNYKHLFYKTWAYIFRK
ncbi:MAG: radical SAM protein [Candidatus Coatesbacteria bacterium]|nr:radical SAM protein [Candidatus Coatesbacteria bacterium]